MTNEREDFLTVAEVAEILRCEVWTVTRLCREHRLRATKPAKTWLIPASAVDELLAAHSNEAAS